LNVGNKPTFPQKFPTSVEIHIFDFNEQLYGQTIKVDISFLIRNGQKFSSVENLIAQIKEDQAYARRRFAKETIGNFC
jgi:FAD synthase